MFSVIILAVFGYCYLTPSDEERVAKIRAEQAAAEAVKVAAADTAAALAFYRAIPEAQPQMLSHLSAETCLQLLPKITAAPTSKARGTWEGTCQQAFDVMPPLTKAQVLAARTKFTVALVDYDAQTPIGSGYATANRIRLRIHNGSAVRLPFLTVRVNRWGANGELFGWARTSVHIGHILPDSTAVVQLEVAGHLPGVLRMTVQIEQSVSARDEEFFEELVRVKNPVSAAPKAPETPKPSAVAVGTASDDVLAIRGQAQSTQQVGTDGDGLLVEWRYPDVTYTMARRERDGVTAYRVIRITPH